MPTLEFALRFTRLLGLAPYDHIPSQSKGRRGKYALNKTYRCVGFAVLGVISVVTVWLSVNDSLRFAGDNLSVMIAVQLVGPARNVLRTCAILPLLWWRQQPLLLQVLNSELFRSLPALPYKKAALPVLAVATYLFGLVAGCTYRWLFTTMGFVTLLTTVVSLFLLLINTGLFAFLLTCVSACIDNVNEPLKNMARNAPVVTDAIVSLRRKHKEAVEAAEKLSCAFTWAVLCYFFTELCWIVKTSFLLLAGPADLHVLNLARLADLLKSVFFFGIIMTVAQQLTTQANHTTLSLIHAIRNARRFLSKESKRELCEFSKQIYQQPLVLSANGIIVFDFSLFLQALGVAATYVVVVVQFHQNQDIKG